MIRVLIADDHPLVRRGLAALIESVPGLEMAGEADGAAAAVVLALEQRPEVVVMDVQMPGGGVEATRQIAAAAPEVAVLMLTMHDDDESVFAAIRAGARGYILKGAEQERVIGAIQAVSRGEAIFGPAVAKRLLEVFGARDAPEPFPDLTAREREILDLIAGGAANAEIAHRLFVSPKTVSNNISSIFSKLEVRDRAQAIVKAREKGLGRRSG